MEKEQIMNSTIIGMIIGGPPEILIIAVWNLLPAVLYYYLSKGFPGRGVWVPVVFLLGWFGYLLAAFFGPKAVKQ